MKRLAMMRVWCTESLNVHIDLLDLNTGFSFEVILTFTNCSERAKAFDIIWNKQVEVHSLNYWFTFFRSIKPLKE